VYKNGKVCKMISCITSVQRYTTQSLCTTSGVRCYYAVTPHPECPVLYSNVWCYSRVIPVLLRSYSIVAPELLQSYSGVSPLLLRSYSGVTPEILRSLLRSYSGVISVLNCADSASQVSGIVRHTPYMKSVQQFQVSSSLNLSPADRPGLFTRRRLSGSMSGHISSIESSHWVSDHTRKWVQSVNKFRYRRPRPRRRRCRHLSEFIQ